MVSGSPPTAPPERPWSFPRWSNKWIEMTHESYFQKKKQKTTNRFFSKKMFSTINPFLITFQTIRMLCFLNVTRRWFFSKDNSHQQSSSLRYYAQAFTPCGAVRRSRKHGPIWPPLRGRPGSPEPCFLKRPKRPKSNKPKEHGSGYGWIIELFELKVKSIFPKSW